MVEIREYDPSRDASALRACLTQLQDFEREIDPRIPLGEEIADRYIDLLFRRCREFEGVESKIYLEKALGQLPGSTSERAWRDQRRE